MLDNVLPALPPHTAGNLLSNLLHGVEADVVSNQHLLPAGRKQKLYPYASLTDL